jgi:hypothetical protein
MSNSTDGKKKWTYGMDLDSRGGQSQRQLTTSNLKIYGKKADNHDGRRDDAESNLWDDAESNFWDDAESNPLVKYWDDAKSNP